MTAPPMINTGFDLRRSWFNVSALIVGLFGPVFFLGAAGFTEPARWTLDVLSWPLDGNMSYASPTVRFLSALTGGFLLGWGVMIWCLGRYIYPVYPEAARKTLVTGALAWFALDSAGSALSGNAINIIGNLLVLIVFVGPHWRSLDTKS